MSSLSISLYLPTSLFLVDLQNKEVVEVVMYVAILVRKYGRSTNIHLCPDPTADGGKILEMLHC